MDQTGSLSLEEARAHIAQAVFAKRLGGPEVGCIGLEPEYLILRGQGVLDRLPLEGEHSVLSALGKMIGGRGGLTLEAPGPPPVYHLSNGGRITFEPGGQVEHSTTVHETAAAAMDDVDDLALELGAALATEGAALVSAGLDLWTDRSQVPQQLDAPRYHAMDAYLSGRSEHGRVMMRHTGSFQVNVDLGEAQVAEERWLLSNLLSPIATASFACSPEDGWKSRRAQAWQGLDPSRTGFPQCMMSGAAVEPGACYSEFALGADLLLFKTDQAGGAKAGTPGFDFKTWIEQGHPELGYPDLGDLDYHLTTLFPEVRLRGFLEIRSIDAVPLRWRAAQVVFWAGLLYDPAARKEALEFLRPRLPLLVEDWHGSARSGFDDAPLHDRTRRIWDLAIAGAKQLPTGYFRTQDLSVAESYVSHFVSEGRTPGDELLELMAEDPKAAMAWCSLPS